MDLNSEIRHHVREPDAFAPRGPAARRRGRPSHQRTAPTSLTNTLRELIARIKAPGRAATLRDVVATLHDTPLGRHGVQSARSLTENARAHREVFAVYPEAVAA